MKHLILFLETSILSFGINLACHAERVEKITYFSGKPAQIIWEIDKNSEEPMTKGRYWFTGNMPGTVEENGSSIWKIPAFDTKGGTRTATGFSINVQARVKATFNADAGTTHKRKIEEEEKWLGLIAYVETGDDNVKDDYKTYDYGWEYHKHPKETQQAKIAWEIKRTTGHTGWVTRDYNKGFSKSKMFRNIRDGKGELEISGIIRWLPYFKLTRDWFGTGTRTLYVDTSTTNWNIPNETIPETNIFGDDPREGTAYPIDALGRRIDYPMRCP